VTGQTLNTRCGVLKVAGYSSASSMKFDLPTVKVESIINEFGLSGEAWVENYPRLLDECVERWDLRLLDTATAGLPINVIEFSFRSVFLTVNGF